MHGGAMRFPLRRYLGLFAQYLRPQLGRTVLMALCLLSGLVLQLVNPQIVGFFIDSALKHGVSMTLVWAGVLFIGVTLAGQGLAIATTYLSEQVAWTATNQLRTDLMSHCL